jgi:hypothetical protein
MRAFHTRGLANTGEAEGATTANIAPVDLRERMRRMWSREGIGVHSLCLIQSSNTSQNRTTNVLHPAEVNP